MIKSLDKFVIKLEAQEYHFAGYFLMLIIIIFLRNFLESFADADNLSTPVNSIAFFIHYPLFYFCALCGFAIIIQRATRQNITAILKILVYFFPLILIGPALDLLFTAGRGNNISYLTGDWNNILYKFLTFSHDPENAGATPGIRIELAVIFAGIGLYVYLKTKTIVRVLIATLSSYSFLFLLGALPAMMENLIKNSVTGHNLFSATVILNHFYTFNHKMSLLLLILTLFGAAGLFYLHDSRKFIGVVKNFRGLRSLHYLSMYVVGCILGLTIFAGPHTENLFFSAIILTTGGLSVLSAWWAAIGINDLYDLDTDHISNRKRPVVSKLISVEEQIIVIMFLLVFSVYGAILVRYQFFLVILTTIFLSVIYSMEPFRLKKYSVVATFIIALSSLLIMLSGFVIFSGNYSFQLFPFRLGGIILLALTLGFTVKDLKDVEGDRIAGIKTIPVLFGMRNGQKITGVLAGISFMFAPFVYFSWNFLIFSLFVAVFSFILIVRNNFKESPVFIIYLIYLMVAFIFIFPVLQRGM